MENKVKVLYFVDRMLKGGIQALVIEIAKNIDREKIQLDFLLLDDGNEYELGEKLKELGCRVYKLDGVWIRKPIDYIKYSSAMNNFFKEHNDYKVVHLHSSSKNYMVLKYAKKYGIPVRIAHSHNIDFQTKNRLKKLIGNVFKILLKKYATDYFACSKLAGQWLFGKKAIDSSKFKIIHNAVDYKKFEFNKEIREKIRSDLDIEKECLVIGHVGRFTNQKNHEFLIDIFNEIHKKKLNSKLLLVGTGILENSIKEKVKMLGLEDYVIFAGFKDNVNDYMFAMDIFVLPSKFEGLGLVLIEAQASGMMCFTSKDVVPLEAKVSDCLRYIQLNNNATEWANEILNSNFSRKDNYMNIKNEGYDIQDTAKLLENFYIMQGE